jgi:hypothetical protein
MANSIGTSPGVRIGRMALDTLLEDFPIFRLVTSDYSAEGCLLGQQLKVQCPNALVAGDYTAADGYVPQDVSQAEYPLTINNHKHVTYGFNDTERSSHDILLVERFAKNAAHALGKAVMDAVNAAITAANFTNYTFIAPATITRQDYIALNKKLNLRKLPKTGRFSILNGDFFGTLSEDSDLVSNPGSPSGTVRSGEIGNVHGVAVHEYTHLAENGEDLVGFAGTAEGLMLATRVPTLPQAEALKGGHVEVITHPETKLSIQLRSWYDFRMGKEYRTYTLMFGVAPGDPARLERIVDVDPAP